MKKAIAIITPIIVVLGVISFFVYQRYINKTIFNNSFVNGNLAGNLYNDGFFCEHNGTVYFSNPNDNYYLYSMTTDGGNVKKLYSDIASYINADDNYVYYVRNNLGVESDYSFLRFNANSLCRLNLKTNDVTVLDPDPSIYASLIGNYVYYIHYDTEKGSTFNRVKIDGTEKETLNQNPYFTCSTNGQYLYYNGLEEDHNIYQLDTSTGVSQTIYQGNCWMPIVNNSKAYFMDCDNNFVLCSLGLSDATPTVLSDQRIECFNIYGDYIYFQTNGTKENPAALCRMNTDGSNLQVIREGNYSNIHITSRYVYFREFKDNSQFFQTPTGGDGTVTVFNP